MSIKNKKRKTRYCEHHINCTIDIDCFAGEACSFFRHTNEFSSIPKEKLIDENPDENLNRWEN